jgi:uncharacterized FlaG/YvyC family protein
MVDAKEAHEYIKIPAFSQITFNLARTSDKLQSGINSAFTARDLHQQRTEELAKARELLNEILKDAEEVEKYLMKDSFRKELAEKQARHTVARTKSFAKPQKVSEDSNYVEKSQKALENLQQNIKELKEQLEI